MFHKSAIAIIAASAAFAGAPALAQSVGMATAKQGAFTYSAGAAIAKVASDKGLSMRIQPFAGTSAYVPVVNKGEMEFGLANQLTSLYALQGKAMFKGRANPNLRVVAIMLPLRGAFFVRKDSPIKKISDLKGKRVPAKYTSARVLELLVKATLANGGLTYADVKQVPVTTVPQSADAYARGRTDVFLFAVGAGKVREIDAKVGGLRALHFNTDAKSVKAMQAHIPVSYILKLKPRKGLAGIVNETPVMAYDYLVLTNSKVKDDAVYKLTKVMHQNHKALIENFRPMAGFNPKRMNKDMGALQFHPGAIKYYKEIGQWPPKKG